jgi:hypothetical protein
MKRTLALLVFLAACGTDGSPGDDFIGTWTYNAGSTTTRTCPDPTLSATDMDTGSFQIAEGTMSDLIAVPQSGDKCPAIKYDVNGKTATIVGGQTCMYTENTQNGAIMVSGAYATGTFTLGADKKTMSGMATGSVTFTGSGGTITCSVTGSMSAVKAGN